MSPPEVPRQLKKTDAVTHHSEVPVNRRSAIERLFALVAGGSLVGPGCAPDSNNLAQASRVREALNEQLHKENFSLDIIPTGRLNPTYRVNDAANGFIRTSYSVQIFPESANQFVVIDNENEKKYPFTSADEVVEFFKKQKVRQMAQQ